MRLNLTSPRAKSASPAPTVCPVANVQFKEYFLYLRPFGKATNTRLRRFHLDNEPIVTCVLPVGATLADRKADQSIA
jgi:hypothetical protein